MSNAGYGWHMHPYGNVEKHEPLPEGLTPKPILTFLARVEELLLQNSTLSISSGITDGIDQTSPKGVGE